MPDAQEKMADFDPQTIRKDFPILAREVHGKPLVYLDNAASAQKPVQVTGRMQRVFDSEYSNVHRGLHYLSNTSTEAFEGARRTVEVRARVEWGRAGGAASGAATGGRQRRSRRKFPGGDELAVATPRGPSECPVS